LKPAMIKSLTEEARVARELLTSTRIDPDLSKRLFEKIVNGKSYSVDTPWTTKEVDRVSAVVAELLAQPDDSFQEYRYHERSDFTLSAHPKLRKFHPEFNPKTGLDHDPVFMQREVERWSDEYLESDQAVLRSAVSGIPIDELKKFHFD